MSDEQSKQQLLAMMNATYDKFRKRIVDEDNIINHRMMWATLAQTGLFAAYGVANLQAVDTPRLIISVMIAAAGGLVAIFNFLSVNAAHQEIRQLESQYERIMGRLRKKCPDSPVDDEYWIGVTGHGSAHPSGHRLDRVLPWVIIGLWLILTVWVLYKGLVLPNTN